VAFGSDFPVEEASPLLGLLLAAKAELVRVSGEVVWPGRQASSKRGVRFQHWHLFTALTARERGDDVVDARRH